MNETPQQKSNPSRSNFLHWNRISLPAILAASFLIAIIDTAVAEEKPSGIKWPEEWKVFVPFDRHDLLIDPSVLTNIPSEIHTKSGAGGGLKSATATRIPVQGAAPVDLESFFEEPLQGNAAFIFLEIGSDRDQTATFGIGADWWAEVWLNGKPVFDSLEKGNEKSEIGISNHRFEATLQKGKNILVVRYITGDGSSTIAIGGPEQFAEEEAFLAEQAGARQLNVLPEKFEDRLLFPVDKQAVAMAERGLQLPQTDADLALGEMAGIQPMPERQVYFRPTRGERGEIVDTLNRRFEEPVTIRLSRCIYPWEDRHLDAIVWTTPKIDGTQVTGQLEVLLKTADGKELAKHEIMPIPPSGVFFSMGFPEALRGAKGILEVIWSDEGKELGRASAQFEVEAATKVARKGWVPIRILNGTNATLPGAPMTVGVPFPHGSLLDESHVRLVNSSGKELPLQTRETARWSRFGFIKWLLCDFTVDLKGKPTEVFLEFGPNIRRASTTPIAVGETESGFPTVNAGRLQITDAGMEFSADSTEKAEVVLTPGALHGAFVEHENGKVFRVPLNVQHEVEESGSEKAVIRRTGWYADPKSGEHFCQFVTRFVFHRNSPVVRIFHTWIFTGDGNSDRIANMGWDFSLAKPVDEGAILASNEPQEWIPSPASLVQFDFDKFLLKPSDEERKGRTPGVLSLTSGDSRVTFGTKDFWQNFPSELEVGKDRFVFYNWPRNNPPARMERPVARKDAFRSRFVHEGELLDFRIPDEYTTGEIWKESSAREGHIAEDRPESVNAQGIARTEEMFLFLSSAAEARDAAARVVEGLDAESIRAVVEPAWLTASGTFGKIHPQDFEKYPEEERLYLEVMQAPARWNERLGFYGMWVFGDQPTWNINLQQQTVSTYRTLRKHHHAYPIRSTAFVRTGDPRFLKFAERALKQTTDANFCHYATADIDAAVGPTHFRRQGWWDRSLLPWIGRSGPYGRSYTVNSDYLWDFYYLTGYRRALDVALLFGEVTKNSFEIASPTTASRSRPTQSLLTSYLDMYRATFDPWFLNAVYEVSKVHESLYGHLEPVGRYSQLPDETGHTWRAADQKMADFSGCPLHLHMALNNAKAWASPAKSGARAGSAGGGGGAPSGLSAYAWRRTGDPFYLQRVAASVDSSLNMIYEGDVEYLRGTTPGIGHGGHPLGFASELPVALAVFEEAGERPEPLGDPSYISGAWIERENDDAYHFELPPSYVSKTGPEAVRLFFDSRGRGRFGRKEPYLYKMVGPEGVEFAGEWRAPETIEIPAEAPQGKYQVFISGVVPYPQETEDKAGFRRDHGQIFYPMADMDTPEVMILPTSDKGTSVRAATQGYWFQVPKGVKEFWIDFQRGGANRSGVGRVSVWAPNGSRAWNKSYTGEAPPKTVIQVPPGQDGKLWRATGGSFELDPQIPPVFSSTRGKWFDPSDAMPGRE